MAKRKTNAVLATEVAELTKKLKDVEDGKSIKRFTIPEEITDPYAKLVYALSDLAGHVERLAEADDTGGSGDFGYSFTSVFDMIDQVRPLLHERGLYMSGAMLLDDDHHSRMKFTTRNGAEGTDLRMPHEWTIENYFGAKKTITVLGEARDTTDKATGKAFTASQKIALRSFCGLSTGDPEDSEQDSIESVGANPERRAQPPRQQDSYGVKITPELGVCPIHDAPFVPPTQKAANAGHGASHKDGDKWCQYGDVRQGFETEVGPMIRTKLGDLETWVRWLGINAEKAQLVHIAKFPRKLGDYRPQDWFYIKKVLSEMPDVQAKLDEGEDGSEFCDQPLADGKPCRLIEGHPDYIAHSPAPSLQEIKDAKEAKEDEDGAEDETS